MLVVLFGSLEQWQDLYVKKMSPVYGNQGFCPELAQKKAYNEFWRMVASENGCSCCCCACIAPELRGKLLV